ncbi:sugar ABC transporter permease [Lactobacillus xujianguonis]|uniref:Sugar ABC transporter permease n=1 Tax=Lactobacillus xujianguonis TaxID=2495899 RepID=A0A437SUZ0_9LACO|nr:sugar ABC transporter permease [Lactobacillus xujianguonis]RVU70758.1 sugar ABC transporter permease [Lactobacillus xujianguonis]
MNDSVAGSVPRKKTINWQKVAPYLFVLPFIISFLLFSVYPFFSAIKMSFEQVNGVANSTWIGMTNYKQLFAMTEFKAALWNVLRYTIWTLVILIPLPMFVAFIINRKGTPLTGFFKSVYFAPVLTSTVIAGLIFRYAFSSDKTGVFNQWLAAIHLGPLDWLEEAHTAMFALVIICVWRWIGVNAIYFLSGLQGISPDLYEAADMDGANGWQKFWYITIPMLKPITIYVLTISIQAGFSLFNESYVYWGSESPNNIGTTLVTLIYKTAFTDGNFGLSCAVGVMLFIIVTVVNAIQTKLMGLYDKD